LPAWLRGTPTAVPESIRWLRCFTGWPAASSYHFHPRPHLVTIVLVGWTFARLCDFEAGRIPLGSLYWLVPVFVLWTNMHGGVLGGVGMVAVTVAGWGLPDAGPGDAHHFDPAILLLGFWRLSARVPSS
jgi:hypothetical protein